jgi:S-DNA-T family DNA segregation ATPase FtsK/SpoIIIE
MKVERVIVLSWFQNLFQKFKRDDEEEFDDYILHKHEESPLLNKYESLKDLDTKVSYQYPKGSYRPPSTLEVQKKENEEILRKKRTESLP